MKTKTRFVLCFLFQIALLLEAAAVGPNITNIRASQRASTKLVDILYDVTDADSATLTVTVQVSTNGGTAYDLHAEAFSGDGYGNRVVPGTDKMIVWDAEQDWNGGYSDQVRFKINAHDGWSPPNDATMVLIPAGTFEMGDSFAEGQTNELPVHTVYLSAFYIDKYEVTCAGFSDCYTWALSNNFTFVPSDIHRSALTTNNTTVEVFEGYNYRYNKTPYLFWAVYDAGGNNSGSTFDYLAVRDGFDSYPCNFVTWHGAAAYCNFRSLREGLNTCYDWVTWECDFSKNGYRLPTEAEWEYTARGGLIGKRYPNGDSIPSEDANYGYSLAPVGTKIPNGYGLFDMAGNVNEWCGDWYEYSYYSHSPIVDPQGPVSGTVRITRGGHHTVAGNIQVSGLRCASRAEILAQETTSSTTGFRCVRPLDR